MSSKNKVAEESIQHDCTSSSKAGKIHDILCKDMSTES